MLGCLAAAQHAGDHTGEWRTYAGTNANLKYSPIDQIRSTRETSRG